MSEVNQFLRNITNMAKTTINHTSNAVKAKLDSVLHKPSMTLTIDELAQYIATHPDTVFDTKVFLGFQYNFYHLKVDDKVFYLETKGDKGDYILELSVKTPTDILFDYHSCDHKADSEEKIRIPEHLEKLVH
ncbi:hypothetical protein [Fredinandcohnia sp. 179-A 10B2 NHS]|uniref:hypothetical protein n=1 Tax=Fredinandcohnia sp. 179-A 10B2 NHS TaxID=3235176 RepID=UPI0039A3E9E2